MFLCDRGGTLPIMGVLLFDRQTDSPFNGLQVPRAPEVGYVNDDVVRAALVNAACAPVGDKATASANGMCVAKGGENINYPGLGVDF